MCHVAAACGRCTWKRQISGAMLPSVIAAATVLCSCLLAPPPLAPYPRVLAARAWRAMPAPTACADAEPEPYSSVSPGAPRGFDPGLAARWAAEQAAEQAEEDAAEGVPQLRRGELLKKRRKVLEGWAAFIQSAGGTQPGSARVLAELRDAAVAFGDRTVLCAQSWEVRRGDRIGVLGESGCGKSTQLRLLAGELPPTSGGVWRSDGLRIALVGQAEVAALRGSRLSLREQLEADAAADEQRDEGAIAEALIDEEEDGEEEEEEEEEDGGDSDGEWLGGVSHLMDAPLAEMSSGQLARAAVARALSRRPQLLLLDEPTNHLDLDGLLWLERALVHAVDEGVVDALLLVSHERETLDRVCTRTLHASGGGGAMYTGGYSSYAVRRQTRREALAQVDGETLTDAVLPERLRPSRFRLNRKPGRPEPPSAAPMLSLRGVRVGFGGADVLRGATLDVRPREAVLLLGENGAGKSTLLRAALGLTAAAGAVELDAGARPFYFAQEAAQALGGELGVLDWLRGHVAEETADDAICRALKRMGLPRADHAKPLRALSGGEKARVLIAQMVLSRANLLLLDEPTNHLDIRARECLEEALRAFDGAMLLVSHDRRVPHGPSSVRHQSISAR